MDAFVAGKGDEALRKKLDDLWKEGETYRDKYSTSWKTAIETVRGKTWPTKRPSYKINAVINFLGQVVEKKAALLTDSRPTIAIASRRQIDDPVCDIIQKVCEGIFEEIGLEQRLTEFVFMEQHFGIGFTKTPWERHLDFGRGDVDITIIDPRQFVGCTMHFQKMYSGK